MIKYFRDGYRYSIVDFSGFGVRAPTSSEEHPHAALSSRLIRFYRARPHTALGCKMRGAYSVSERTRFGTFHANAARAAAAVATKADPATHEAALS